MADPWSLEETQQKAWDTLRERAEARRARSHLAGHVSLSLEEADELLALLSEVTAQRERGEEAEAALNVVSEGATAAGRLVEARAVAAEAVVVGLREQLQAAESAKSSHHYFRARMDEQRVSWGRKVEKWRGRAVAAEGHVARLEEALNDARDGLLAAKRDEATRADLVLHLRRLDDVLGEAAGGETDG